MGCQKTKKAAGITTFAILVTLLTFGHALAMDVQFRLENVTTASDNINRVPEGQELDGYLLSFKGDLSISEDFKISDDIGTGSVDFGFGGGWESLNDGESRNSNSHYLDLKLYLPRRSNGYIQGSANFSDAVAVPEITETSQARVRTRNSNQRLEAGAQASPTLAWQAAMKNRTVERFDRDLIEAGMEVGFDLDLDRKSKFAVDAGFLSGTEYVEEDRWSRASLSFDLQKQLDRISSNGYRLSGEVQKLDQVDGTTQWSDIVSFLYYYVTKTPARFSLFLDLGVDGISPPSNERFWKALFKFGLEGPLHRRVGAKGAVSSSSALQDPVDDEIVRTRDNQAQAALIWDVSRMLSIEPRAQYRSATLFDAQGDERKDITLLMELKASWVPIKDLAFGLSAQKERRNSSQDTFDLLENRVELKVVGTLF